jgi:hypothetical protein
MMRGSRHATQITRFNGTDRGPLPSEQPLCRRPLVPIRPRQPKCLLVNHFWKPCNPPNMYRSDLRDEYICSWCEIREESFAFGPVSQLEM